MEHLQREIPAYIFREVAAREGAKWLGPKRREKLRQHPTTSLFRELESWAMPLEKKTRARIDGVGDLTGLLETHMLKGVRLDSHMGLWGLVSKRYPLILRRDIPSPHEMLERQCLGERYVSFLKDDVEVGRFKNRYEFLLHDLEHAHKFFGDADLFRGQVNFFKALKTVLTRFDRWRDDPLFEKDFNYLMSDMNSHPVHLFKYMKAIVLTAELRSGRDGGDETFWENILKSWGASSEVMIAASRINRPEQETPADQLIIHDFFLRQR